MAAKADTPAPQLSGVQLYSRFAVAGAICCSVTHGALTPVDVYVPTRSSGNALAFSHYATRPEVLRAVRDVTDR